MSIVLFSLALCLFVLHFVFLCSVMLLYAYIVYSTGMKVELHIWNNDKVKCHVFYPWLF